MWSLKIFVMIFFFFSNLFAQKAKLHESLQNIQIFTQALKVGSCITLLNKSNCDFNLDGQNDFERTVFSDHTENLYFDHQVLIRKEEISDGKMTTTEFLTTSRKKVEVIDINKNKRFVENYENEILKDRTFLAIEKVAASECDQKLPKDFKISIDVKLSCIEGTTQKIVDQFITETVGESLACLKKLNTPTTTKHMGQLYALAIETSRPIKLYCAN